MLYKNTKSGTIHDFKSEVGGKDWVKVEEKKTTEKPVKKTKAETKGE